MTEHTITLPDDSALPGSTPVVLIGPNGSGKTRFGATLASKSRGARIPALRSLSISTTINARSTRQAREEVQNKANQYISEVFRQADELNEMLSELKAEQADAAIQFQAEWITDRASARPSQTRLDTMLALWEEIFPGRKLDLSSYEPKVRSTHLGSPQEYTPNTMSDGERAALYLIPSVLRAPAGVVVVDEPEVHFHTLLARTFWDALERARPNCRFVFVTHDLQFALSRRNGSIGIVSNPTTARFINTGEDIPAELVEALLGAASLSLIAKRMVFSEGIPGASIDAEFYGAWFHSPDTAVIPLGGCRRVQEAVRVFQSKVLSNVTALGIIERDYWPDAHLVNLGSKQGFFVLAGQEIESIFCYRNVAEAVMAHLGVSGTSFDSKFRAFEDEVKKAFVGGRRNKHTLERVKVAVDSAISGATSKVAASDDVSALRASLVTTFATSMAGVDVGAMFDQQDALISDAVAAGPEKFLPILPGKDCLTILTSILGISEDVYVTTITAALRPHQGSEEDKFKLLRVALEAALMPVLPPR